ncbi:acetyl-CoA carboxylase, biotin carboxyl carrier protein [Myxococcota bacterium]|nr:acetyl-CoA carboxylase, biotin carboxyl carrier protein [Myxococcota bacterium]
MPDQDPKPPVTPKVSAPGEPRAVAAAPMTAERPEPDYSADYTVSPFVGNVYLQARPTDPPFVKVGDIVRAGQTVCVIEAMKLFNEVESDLDCVIDEILVTNGQYVEFGTKLFRVRPL